MVNYIERAEQAGLSWPLPDTLTDVELERLLYPRQKSRSAGDLVWPDWSLIRQELQKKNVTLFLLWQEYREQHPKGYQYSVSVRTGHLNKDRNWPHPKRFHNGDEQCRLPNAGEIILKLGKAVV